MVSDDHLAIEAHMVLKPTLNALNSGKIALQVHIKLVDSAETLASMANEPGFHDHGNARAG